ncbi:MAG: hypothetical protein WCZ28_06255 [Burkholderiaceae bacterium]
MAEKVRYQVLQKVFVNGSLIDPKGRKDVFVYAAPGLAGKALKLAPEKGKPKPAGDSGGGNGNGEGGGSETT